MNNLEKLIANITVKIIEKKQQQLDLLNKNHYLHSGPNCPLFLC